MRAVAAPHRPKPALHALVTAVVLLLAVVTGAVRAPSFAGVSRSLARISHAERVERVDRVERHEVASSLVAGRELTRPTSTARPGGLLPGAGDDLRLFAGGGLAVVAKLALALHAPSVALGGAGGEPHAWTPDAPTRAELMVFLN